MPHLEIVSKFELTLSEYVTFTQKPKLIGHIERKGNKNRIKLGKSICTVQIHIHRLIYEYIIHHSNHN